MLTSYYPEMNEARPVAQIEASLGHYGKHWFLRTRLELKGRGVQLLETIKESDIAHSVPAARAAELVGSFRYKVTDAAFEKIKAAYSVSCECLL